MPLALILPRGVCVCVCFLPIYSGRQACGHTSRGYTGERSHRISHPPSFCGAFLNFSREKNSAVPFVRRPWSRILCTTALIVLHLLGIFLFFVFCFYFFVRKNPSYRGSNSRPNVSEGFEITNWTTGATGCVCVVFVCVAQSLTSHSMTACHLSPKW